MTNPTRDAGPARPDCSQPVRWPTLPDAPLVLVGRTVSEYSNVRYAQFGPFWFEVDRDRHGYKFAVSIHGPWGESLASVKVRVPRPAAATPALSTEETL